MGVCRDCLHFDRTDEVERIFSSNVYRCTYLNQYVRTDGSCSAFQQRPTYNSGGCFLTSACVDYLGKPDDCEELTTLRKFRDEYVKNLPDGEAIVKEYYAVAPAIVQKINVLENKNDYYDYIYQTICACIKLYEFGYLEQTLVLYKEMVLKLKKELDI